MAGEWIKVQLDLPEKPEVFEIASMLQLDPDAVVGKLLRVWGWFDKHTVDGNAVGVTFALLDRLSGVTGFGEAMNFVGWVQQNDRTLTIPNFDKHNGETAKARALGAKRQEKRRGRDESNANSNAASVTTALPREEKRREEIKEEPLLAAKAARRQRLPDDFFPDQTGITKATESGITVASELERFKDYHRGKGTTMLDWQAAWRTWVNNAVKFGAKNGNSNRDRERAETLAILTGRTGTTYEAG